MTHLSSLDPPTPPRRPLRPLHGIPEKERRGPTGFLFSLALHLAILLALLVPAIIQQQLDLPLTGGGGGSGPAGGGGGGNNGTGGETVRPEALRFLQVAPAPSAPAVETPPVVVPPLEEKPEPVKPPEVTRVVPPPVARPTLDALASSIGTKVPIPGRGGGTGSDGTSGTGPGKGGGVGSGEGTGRGSGSGPGTGGGPGDIYPPTVTNLAILPIPVPDKVRPYKMVAYFDVDERGNATLISFNPSNDRGYNRKIRSMLEEVRFRPAVRYDGTPVRDTAWITAEAPR